MAKKETYLDYPLSEQELIEVLNGLHDRKKGLSEAISGGSQFIISDNETKVKIATVDLAMSKFQSALWRVQST